MKNAFLSHKICFLLSKMTLSKDFLKIGRCVKTRLVKERAVLLKSALHRLVNRKIVQKILHKKYVCKENSFFQRA